jgi:hypothetical protein
MYENGKMKLIENISGMGREGIKENVGRDEFSCDIL